jgi:hypothetical protein
VEVVEGHQQDAYTKKVHAGSLNTDLAGGVYPQIRVDAAGCVVYELLLAVMSAYLRMGNVLMKLRLNITYQLYQLYPHHRP